MTERQACGTEDDQARSMWDCSKLSILPHDIVDMWKVVTLMGTNKLSNDASP